MVWIPDTSWSISDVPSSAAVPGAAVADLLDAFPDRPIGLTPRAAGKMATGLTALAVIALIPALIFGWLLLGELSLRSDLKERGVRTPMLERDVCSAGFRQRICSGTARYAVRPEHGGGVREGTFHRYLYQPIAIYDPVNPDRALSPADLEAGPGDGYYAGTFIPLGFSLLFAALAFGGFRKDRRLATARGRPLPVPVISAGRHAKEGKEDWEETDVFYAIDYRPPGSKKTRHATFPEALPPFLLGRAPPAPSAALDILALELPGGEIVPLDRDLTYLDLSDAERAAILRRVAGEATRAAEPPPSTAGPADPPDAAASDGPAMGPDPHALLLKDLLRLVQRQAGPSRALDLQIYDALFGRPGRYGYQCNRPARRTETYDDELNRSLPPPPAPKCPAFTADVENARLLIPGYMSSWGYVGSDASVHEVALGHDTRGVRGETEALAICAAVIAHYADYPQELRRNV